MDDEISKTEKLAAARRKLKEFQAQQRNKYNASSESRLNKNIAIELASLPPLSTVGHVVADTKLQDSADEGFQLLPPVSTPVEDVCEIGLKDAPLKTGTHQSQINFLDESTLKCSSTTGKKEEQPQLTNYFTTASAATQSKSPMVFFDNAPQNCPFSSTSSTLETSSAGITTYTAANIPSSLSPVTTIDTPSLSSLNPPSSPKIDNDLARKQVVHSDIIPPSVLSASLSQFSHNVTIPNRNITEDDRNTMQMVENLQSDLESARSKIKLQSQALDILTNEREDLQIRLSNALLKVDAHEDTIRSLTNELQSNVQVRQQLLSQLNEFTESLENFRALETTLRQNINDYQAENEILKRQVNKTNEENDKLQAELNETKHSRDMLALKFTQLGMEVNDATDTMDKNYKAIGHELEYSKRKCAELEVQLKSLTFEKESAGNEYKQYVQSMQQELALTQSEMEKLGAENQQLLEKITSQTEHIYTLEKQIQQQRSIVTDEMVNAGQVTSAVDDLKNEISFLKREMNEMKIQYEERLHLQESIANHWKESVTELESQLEILRSESTNNGELQAAIESNKVAASQAILQNNKLKTELEKLNRLIEKLKEENETLNSQLLAREKVENETRMATSSNSNSNETYQVDNAAISKSDVAINTEIVETNNESNGQANLIAMMRLQEKFKSVLDRMADLTDEKQQLEHLVLQLQSETETIEEYVALYQKQRSVLRQRARENDLKLERVSQEKERLLNVIRTILTSNHFDCSIVRQLIEKNLSTEMNEEISRFSISANSATMTDMAEHSTKEYPMMNSFFATSESLEHHPTCHCCSGKLITV